MELERANSILKILVFRFCLFSLLIVSTVTIQAQKSRHQKLELFDLSEVKLDDSLFKNARETDHKYILKMEPDRLLAPFLREAGLSTKADSYPNWENTGLDGHIAGHYITTLSQLYASIGDQKIFHRLEYMLQELEKVQEANANGYIGGVPGSKKLWSEIQKGNINAGSFSLNDKWVPLYNIHKTFAGLRDAYEIAGVVKAKTMLINFTNWMLNISKDLTDEQIQDMLESEHGGLNEVFADVARITGDDKYLELAYRFSQKSLLNPLKQEDDILNGMHANTQIPKVIGFEAIAEIDGNENYHHAAQFFWDNVVKQRSVAIGGNSVREHFNPKNDFSSMISSVQGPETCNTYNMVKLSKMLFLDNAEEQYINFYEQALYNHILSSQNPETGGFVYFTPMRPGHYRVYSQPETSFWCCVGSGLENHTKYNELIYAHSENELYVNLFIASAVDWKEKGISISQHTNFPNTATSTLMIEADQPTKFNLKIRYPEWVAKDSLRILINGKRLEYNSVPGSYVSVNREWKTGDEVELLLPMQIKSVSLPDESNYKAIMYGPLVLATRTGSEDMEGEYADASRGGHIAEGKIIPLTEMPYFLSDKTQNIEKLVKKIPGENLRFSASEIIYPEKFKNLEFVPFYQIHNSRYAIYLPVNSSEEIEKINEELKKKEEAEKRLVAMTIDRVLPGEQQPESDHFIESENSNIGTNQNKHWRDARGWFSYQLIDKENKAHRLAVTYYGRDAGRNFQIKINDQLLVEEHLEGNEGDRFFTREYEIPKEVLEYGETELRLRFEALPGSVTAGIYDIRLLKNDSITE